ncbi:MAG: hypothetical protein ACREB8_01375 [Pseudolabrys sp.]
MQLKIFGIDAARDIGGQYQQQVDRFGSARYRDAKAEQQQKQRQRRPHQTRHDNTYPPAGE